MGTIGLEKHQGKIYIQSSLVLTPIGYSTVEDFLYSKHGEAIKFKPKTGEPYVFTPQYNLFLKEARQSGKDLLIVQTPLPIDLSQVGIQDVLDQDGNKLTKSWKIASTKQSVNDDVYERHRLTYLSNLSVICPSRPKPQKKKKSKKKKR